MYYTKSKLLLLTIIIIFFSCSKNDNSINYENAPYSNENFFVSYDKAVKVAENHPNYSGTQNLINIANKKVASINKNKKKKKIGKSLSVNPNNTYPSYYIIDYEGGGFMIVSADKRTNPILAHSDHGSVLNSNYNLPEGLIYWLKETNDYVNYIRDTEIEQSKSVKDKWMLVERVNEFSDVQQSLEWGESYPGCEYDGQPLPHEEETYLISTANWDQGVGFNNSLPDYSCINPYNGKPPVGCVATATGIIMRFHQHPSTLAWSSMPMNSGSTEIANLMRDIGIHVGMDYSCEGSGASTADIPSILRNKYSYNADNITNFDGSYNLIKQNIKANLPLIASGGEGKGWWIFKKYIGGHAWVIDGYNEEREFECTNYEDEIDWLERQYKRNYVKYHMNWGWGGAYNGWFYTHDWSNSVGSFNYKRKLIGNIRPK